MFREEAVQLVESRREKLNIDPDMQFEQVDPAIVQHKRNPNKPGRTKDRVAWIVRFASECGFVEILIDVLRGKVLRVRRHTA